jgi:hypothetical protein
MVHWRPLLTNPLEPLAAYRLIFDHFKVIGDAYDGIHPSRYAQLLVLDSGFDSHETLLLA